MTKLILLIQIPCGTIRVGSDFCVSFSHKEKNTKNRIHGQTTVKCRLNRFGKERKRLQI